MATTADDVVMQYVKEAATLRDVFPQLSLLADIGLEENKRERQAMVHAALESSNSPLKGDFVIEWMHIMQFAFLARMLYRSLQETRLKLDEVVASQIANLDPEHRK